VHQIQNSIEAPNRIANDSLDSTAIARMGGKHKAAQGVSTKPERWALLDWFERQRRECAGKADLRW